MKFLVVDDDEGIQLYIAKILNDYGEVEQAWTADEAEDLFARALGGTPVQAVFMDIMLPGRDGHDIAARLRDMERLAGIPAHKGFKLIMMSALDDVDNVGRAYYQGQASGYVTKPFTRDRLVSELRVAGLLG